MPSNLVFSAVGQVADNLQDVSMFRFKGVSKGSENCVSATADKKSPRNVDLDAALAEASSLAVPTSVSDSIKFTDKLLYIYTSGTTGLPKAAVIKNSRHCIFRHGIDLKILPTSYLRNSSRLANDVLILVSIGFQVFLLLRWNVLPEQHEQHQRTQDLQPLALVSQRRRCCWNWADDCIRFHSRHQEKVLGSKFLE